MGRENVKNIQKTNQICYCLGGGGWGIQNLGGKISPPKGPEKNTDCLAFVHMQVLPDEDSAPSAVLKEGDLFGEVGRTFL